MLGGHNGSVSRSSRTTAIKRPSTRSSDEGRSRLGDFTRPIPVDKRVSRRPRIAMLAGILALLVIGTIAAAVFVLPIQTWQDQDVDLEQRQAQLDELSKVNSELAAEVARLETEDGVREAAKEEIGYVETGEQRYSVLPFPELPSDLPDGWPYNVVEEIMSARRAGPAPVVAD